MRDRREYAQVLVDMATVVDAVVRRAQLRWGTVERQDIARTDLWEGLEINARKPDWLRTKV